MSMRIRFLMALVAVLATLGVVSWTMDRGATRAASVVAGPSAQVALPTYDACPDFTLLDEDGRTVTRADLAGHPWILNFVYTSCTTSCPMVMRQVAGLRRALDGLPGLRTVTVTVDPKRDRPAAMKKYEQRYGGHDSRYLYLTGDRRVIVTLLQGLHLVPQGKAVKLDLDMHSTRLILVDATGHVRGYFPYDDAAERAHLAAAVATLDGAKTP